MVRPRRHLVIIASIAAALWVVPSLGTQGMGTIGQRFSHPDRDIVDSGAAKTPALLHRADRIAEAAVLRPR